MKSLPGLDKFVDNLDNAQVRPTIAEYPQISQAMGKSIGADAVQQGRARRRAPGRGRQVERGAEGARSVTSDAAAAPPPRTLRQRIFGETPSAWVFVAPAAVIIVGLAIVPIGWSLRAVVPRLGPGHAGHLGRLRELRRAARRPDLRSAVGHTLLYTGAVRPAEHRARARSWRSRSTAASGSSASTGRRSCSRSSPRRPRRACCSRSSSTQRFGVANAVARQARDRAAGLPRRPGPGAVRDRADRAVGRDRLLGDHLPRGAAGRPARPRRGGARSTASKRWGCSATWCCRS